MKFSFIKHSKKGISFLPDLPKDSHSSSTSTDFTPLKKQKNGINKKIIIGIGVVLSVIIVGLTAYIATRSQPQTTKTHAAESADCISITIGQNIIDACPDSVSLSADKTSATALFHIAINGGSGTTTASVPVNQSSYWCTSDTGTCQANPNVTDQTYTLDSTNNTQIISISRKSDTSQPCGAFQFDITISSQKLSQSVATGSDCAVSDTPTPSQSPAPVPPGVTSTPKPTDTFSLSGVIYSSTSLPVSDASASSCTPVGTGLNGVDVSLKLNGVVVQEDKTHNASNVGAVVPGTYEFNNLDAGTYSLCIAVPSGSQISCPASIGPNASNCFTEAIPSADDTAPVNFNLASISTPSSTPSGTPSPTNSVGSAPTPTDKVVLITATPTPTTIIVVAATNTPGPTTAVQSTPVASPSIPSAGNPLPYIAVAIPFVLILIAFVL
jgi:hypothetical protein